MTAIDEGARLASRADVSVVAQFAARAAAEMVEKRGGGVWARHEARPEPLEAGLLRDVDDRDAVVVIGTIDGTAVGYGAARLLLLHDGASLARVGDLYVLPEARGVGVGEAIISMLIGWAHERGCIGVDSLALPGDRHTKNFFETHKMVARSITVHRSLDADRDVERPVAT